MHTSLWKKALALGAVAPMLLAACSSGGKAASASNGGIFTTVNEAHPITAGAPMNPFNASGNTFDSYDQLELGYSAFSPTNPNASFPALAASWSLGANGSLTVHLQPKARWSNGAPVTARDVKDSVAIAFTQGTQPSNLASVTILGQKEIRFNTIPGTTNQLFTAEVLATTVVPASVYGKELPSNIWSTITASTYTGSNPARAAAARKAQATLTALGKKIAAFAPAKDVSAGPFVLVRLNPGEALLTANPYFWARSKIAPKEVVMRNYTGNQQIWNYLIAGQLDAAPYTAMPTNVLDEILRTAGNKELKSPAYVAASLAFDEKDYPYGLTAVRQAIAYVLNRKQITKVGESVSGQPVRYQTGIIDSIAPKWLSHQELASLNPYSLDPAKAAALLKSAHFTKRGGQWYLPSGKPWTMSIESVSGFSDWIAAGKFMASELSSFGIPTTESIAPDYATYLANLAKGDYPVAFWLTALGPSVADAYDRIWGPNDGFVAVGNTVQHHTAGNWMNTPTSYDLPSIGRVQPGTLTGELTALTGSAAKAAVAKLAAADNAELPVIGLWDYVNVQFVNDKHFTDWPVGQPGLLNDPAGVWMMQGYVHAK